MTWRFTMIGWSNSIRPSIKLCCAFCLCLLCPVVLSAQAVTDGPTQPSVLTLKHERRVETRHLPSWEDDSPPDTPAPVAEFRRMRIVEVYSVKIKNTGAKKITGVVWDYVFIGLRDEKELARVRFGTKTKVSPGGSTTLEGTLRAPPHSPNARVVRAEDIGKEGDRKYREEVEVKCVLYEDGTWWRQKGVTEEGCVRLESAKRISGW